MIFGGKESFDYIYHKIKDDDYILDFHYRLVPEPLIVIKVTNRKYQNVTTEVYLTKKVWDDKEHLTKVFQDFKKSQMQRTKIYKIM